MGDKRQVFTVELVASATVTFSMPVLAGDRKKAKEYFLKKLTEDPNFMDVSITEPPQEGHDFDPLLEVEVTEVVSIEEHNKRAKEVRDMQRQDFALQDQIEKFNKQNQ